MSGTTSSTSVIVAGARTPMGRLLGSLKTFSGADLGGFAIKAALDRAGIGGDQVQYVIMGQVLQAGAGQIPARQAAVKAGIPMNVPALTVNKVCLSGLDAIALADQLIRAGEFDIVVAGGQESMTNAPHLLPKSREGYKYGAIEMLDAMAYDGLTDAFENIAMGESTEKHNTRLGILRPEQDEIAAALPPARGRRPEERRLRGGDHPGRDPAAQGRPGRLQPGRGHPRRDDRGVPGQAAPGLHQGRHDHRGHVLADLRRRGGRRRDEQGQGRGTRPGVDRGDRRPRQCGGPGQLAPVPALQRHPARARRRRAWASRTST